MILCVPLGKYFCNSEVVIHAPHLVFNASDLYFIESKKEISFSFAFIKVLISEIMKSFLKLISANILFNLKFFFLEKKNFLH